MKTKRPNSVLAGAVFLGGMLGTWTRWAVDTALSHSATNTWLTGENSWWHLSLGLIAVNLIGTLILATWKSAVGVGWGKNIPTPVATGFTTGFLGSFTTYSSLALAAAGEPRLGCLTNMAVLLLLGLVAAAIGTLLGMKLGSLSRSAVTTPAKNIPSSSAQNQEG